MIRVVGQLGLCVALAACASGPAPARGLSDPAVQRLMAKPAEEYFAEQNLAGAVAGECGRYRFDAALVAAIDDSRAAQGWASNAAVSHRAGTELMTDVRMREFQAKHGRLMETGGICAAADAEFSEGSALAALLVPVRG